MKFPIMSDYRWAAGHNVALGSLLVVESEVGAYNRISLNNPLRPVGIKSEMVDEYPVRTLTGSGRERGDGIPDHEWVMTVALLGLGYILDTYLDSADTVSVPMTIYTRLHWRDTFARYNCYLNLPKPKRDIAYADDKHEEVYRVRWHFTGMVKLS